MFMRSNGFRRFAAAFVVSVVLAVSAPAAQAATFRPGDTPAIERLAQLLAKIKHLVTGSHQDVLAPPHP
jgi:hypothetical protein